MFLKHESFWTFGACTQIIFEGKKNFDNLPLSVTWNVLVFFLHRRYSSKHVKKSSFKKRMTCVNKSPPRKSNVVWINNIQMFSFVRAEYICPHSQQTLTWHTVVHGAPCIFTERMGHHVPPCAKCRRRTPTAGEEEQIYPVCETNLLFFVTQTHFQIEKEQKHIFFIAQTQVVKTKYSLAKSMFFSMPSF